MAFTISSKPLLNIKLIATYAALTWANSLLGIANAGMVNVTVLDKEGKPAPDAIVVLVPTGKGTPKTPLPMQATIIQEKMQFIPAVSLVGAGAKVRFVNNDPWDHHVRASAGGMAQLGNTSGTGNAAGYELRLEGKTEGKPAKSAEITMDKVGAQSAVLLGCFLHGSMRGNVYVSDSPWAAKTGANGVAQIDDVPEGSVQIKVWHAEQLIDLPIQQITVRAVPADANVQLQITPRRARR
jgi:plastocyanin